MNKEEKQYVVESSVKALVSLIPGIGGAMGSILSDALADRKEQRIKEFIGQLKQEIEQNMDSVNRDFLSKDDFLDIFEATAKKIANERDTAIRMAYKNIIVHAILSPGSDYDVVEYQMRILDQLNKDHIVLLGLFYRPRAYNIPDVSNMIGGSLLTLLRKVLPDWDTDYLFDHLRDLENNRLIDNITNGLQTMMSRISVETLEGRLSSKGMSFVQYIIRQ